MPKLNRIYELRVQTDGIGSNPGDMIIIRSPLTLEFHCERNNMADMKNAKFKIYNLSKDNRMRIFHDINVQYQATDPIGETMENGVVVRRNYPRLVAFYAGYEGEESNMTLVFLGQMQYANSTRRGSDFITEIDAVDPGTGMFTTESAIALSKDISKEEVIRSLYVDLVGKDVAQSGYISKTFTDTPKRGRTYFGHTINILRELTFNSFYFDLGKPMAVPIGEAIPDLTVYEITSGSGLISSPVKSGTVVTVRMVFSPEIRIGQPIALNAEESQYNGIYKAIGVIHSGMISGTHDQQTVTELSMSNYITAFGKAT